MNADLWNDKFTLIINASSSNWKALNHVSSGLFLEKSPHFHFPKCVRRMIDNFNIWLSSATSINKSDDDEDFPL